MTFIWMAVVGIQLIIILNLESRDSWDETQRKQREIKSLKEDAEYWERKYYKLKNKKQ